jgi:hypothetical protein
MHQGSRDIISGSVLLVLSIALYMTIPGQVETLTGESLTPASLPFAITAIIGVLSAVLLIQGIRAARKSASAGITIDTGGLIYVGSTIVVMLTYVALIPWIGFIAATAAVLLLLAMLFNNRNWKQILIMMVIAPPAIMIFFRYTMLVLLPQGKFFG